MTNADQAYREGATRGSTPVGRVVMLYDQLVRDLTRASAAIAAGDVPRRSDELAHAHDVIGVLQGTLDLERGGDVARSLDRMYSILRRQLLDAQCAASTAALQEPIQIVLSLREAWMEVERQIVAADAVTPTVSSQPSSVPATSLTGAESVPMEWQA